MSITVKLPSGSTIQTDAFGTVRPTPGDYVTLNIGGIPQTYTVRWVQFPGTGITIGAALPSDPSPPPPQ